jgi:hypothetical protein
LTEAEDAADAGEEARDAAHERSGSARKVDRTSTTGLPEWPGVL